MSEVETKERIRGEDTARHCGHCGKRIPDNHGFCQFCGEKVDEGPPSASTVRKPVEEPAEKQGPPESSGEEEISEGTSAPSQRGVRAHCTYEGADLSLKTSPSVFVTRFRENLERNLGGLLDWRESAEGADIVIRFKRIDAGNRGMRYLLPFGSPCLVEIEGEVSLSGSPRSFQCVERADFGLFGGSEKEMFERLMRRLAKSASRSITESSGQAIAHAEPGRQVAPGPARAGAASGFCIASLVLGIGAFLFAAAYGAGIAIGAVALVLGALGLKATSRNHLLKGRGLAIAGMICGSIGTVFSVVMLVALISASSA